MNSLPPAFIMIAGALLLPFFPARARSYAYLAFPVLAFLALLRLPAGVSLTLPLLNYELIISRVDQLSMAFGYVITIMAFIGGLYGFHLRERLQPSAALLYAGSSLGVVFAGDLLTLFIFWELMTVGSVALIWARRTPASYRASMRYLIVHLFGGGLLMAGILWHYTETGSLLFEHLSGSTGAYMILAAFAINAAIPPLHAWLPDAYPEATVTGTVFLSAFTTKVAVYTLARGFAGYEILVWAGTIMALYGVVFAVLENDIRRLLAYHIISQVGYMVAAVGMGTGMALDGATAHAFAHILYKGLLLMGAGAVIYATGKSKLTELGGLAKAMPLVLGLYMVGAFSISGFPLFSGFVSKSIVISAASADHREVIAMLLSVASVGTFLHTGLKLPYFTWFGPKRQLTVKPIPTGMYLAMALTALLCFGIGVFPSLFYRILPFPIEYHPYTATHLLETMQLLIFTGLGFWLLIGRLGGTATVTLDTDWFYRKPAPVLKAILVTGLSRLFGAVERNTYAAGESIARLGANPMGYLIVARNMMAYYFFGSRRPTPEPRIFNPHRYRLPLGTMTALVMLSFVLLMLFFIVEMLSR